MKKTKYAVVILLATYLTACGPSAEEIKSMTEAAYTDTPMPTSTPEPTPTPTPIPYDLTVSVQNVEGNAIPGATIMFPQSGVDQPITGDEEGQFFWNNLEGPEVSLMVSAQGYEPAESSESIERGANEMVVALERDPYGLLPDQACNPDESLFAVYDFENHTAVGWQEIEFGAQGWTFVPDPEAEENAVVQLQGSPGTELGTFRGDLPGNYAMRFRFLAETALGLSISISQVGNEQGESFYQIILSPPGSENPPELRRVEIPVSNIPVRNLSSFQTGTWNTLEVSRYQDTLEIWLNSNLVANYQDPMPLESSGIGGISIFPYSDPSTVLFDDMSICELSAPFAPLQGPEESEEEAQDG
ncbi:MAG: carboxypeptidase regulatory-like domain-containing protein [Chloroflexi bacterium]|nr:MAG: carboxypeptidase regulatory-like domain-containing protein [Chloroflexota bacterium]MBL1195067.1 carboxypeptidase regulatory-like domain-containing protein [Chloroflexota bacterium]NOH12355.1 carboxypeptidase regulatory-like domain-containing protein [Chloroflexota bacterium]